MPGESHIKKIKSTPDSGPEQQRDKYDEWELWMILKWISLEKSSQFDIIQWRNLISFRRRNRNQNVFILLFIILVTQGDSIITNHWPIQQQRVIHVPWSSSEGKSNLGQKFIRQRCLPSMERINVTPRVDRECEWRQNWTQSARAPNCHNGISSSQLFCEHILVFHPDFDIYLWFVLICREGADKVQKTFDPLCWLECTVRLD